MALFAAHNLADKEMKKIKTLKHRLRVRTNKELFLKLVEIAEREYLRTPARSCV